MLWPGAEYTSRRFATSTATMSRNCRVSLIRLLLVCGLLATGGISNAIAQ